MSNLRAEREAVVERHIAAENGDDADALIASFHCPRHHVVPIAAVSDGEAAVGRCSRGWPVAFRIFGSSRRWSVTRMLPSSSKDG